jgi:DNA-binding GntR family transcriptional regulator
MINVLDIRKKTLSETAYDSLREDIIFLNLKPGQTVYENDESQKLGMSRTPLRDAFRKLQSEELLEVFPQRGARIALISSSKVEEVRFVRECLEINGFLELAKLWQVNDPYYRKVEMRVAAILEEQRMAAASDDAKGFLLADEAFHQMLLQQTGNGTLLTVVHHMRGHLNRLRYLMLAENQQMDDLIKEHELLFKAVMKRDESGIISILQKHLRKLLHGLDMMQEKYPDYFVNETKGGHKDE